MLRQATSVTTGLSRDQALASAFAGRRSAEGRGEKPDLVAQDDKIEVGLAAGESGCSGGGSTAGRIWAWHRRNRRWATKGKGETGASVSRKIWMTGLPQRLDHCAAMSRELSGLRIIDDKNVFKDDGVGVERGF